MKKKWYEIIPQFLKELPIDIEPMIWFVMSAILIFLGFKQSLEGNAAAATLYSALGGAGIARIRGGRKPQNEIQPKP